MIVNCTWCNAQIRDVDFTGSLKTVQWTYNEVSIVLHLHCLATYIEKNEEHLDPDFVKALKRIPV